MPHFARPPISPMKRVTLIAVATLAAAHALCLLLLPTAASRVHAGNLIRIALVALAGYTLVAAYRRTAGFVRIAISALAVAMAGNILRLVYQAVSDLHHISGQAYFLLLFLYVLPAAMIVVLPERVGRYRDLHPYALDIVQLGIACSAFYFLFYYPLHPSGATPESMAMLLEIRNYILISALPARILLSRRASVRDVLMRITAIVAVQQFDLVSRSGASPEIGVYTGSLLDLHGVLTPGIAIILFALLPDSSDAFLKPESRPLSFTLRAHVLPAVLPAAVWLMAIGAAREHKGIALVLATISALCYGTRWYVVQHQASRDALQLWRSERRLRALAEAFSARDRDEFFQSIATLLCKTLGTKYALIGESAGGDEIVRTLAVAESGKPAPNFTYGLQGTPCAKVIENDYCYIGHGVATQFPDDKALADMGAEAYMGQRLHGTSGSVLGLLVLISDRPFADPAAARQLLQICSTPVGIEIERSRAEEGLRSTEEKLALAFKQSPNGVAIVDASDLTYQDVNDSFAAIYGAPKEEIIGRTSRQIDSFVNPAEREWAHAELRTKGVVRNLEFQARTKTGEIKTLQGNADAIDFRGKKLWLVTLRDVTLERAAEKALQQSERKYRDLFQNANDFIFTLDFAGRFLSMNKKGEVLTGLAGVESMRGGFEDIINAASRPRFREILAAVLAGEKTDVLEVTLLNGAGSSAATVLEVALRLVSQDGQPVAVQGIARDVSDRRALEKKFIQMQKLQAVGTLAGGVAHDFNNLLTVITGYVHLATAALGPEHPVREDVEEIGKATDRAASLTRQLLTFSRQQVTNRTALNINDSVRGMEKMLRRVLGEGVELLSELEHDIPRVFADPGQIDQVILNLAVNARDAMPRGGKLRFRTHAVTINRIDAVLDLPAGDYVVLEVIDNGGGMDEATQSRIFEPFFTTKDVGKGTGLGLSTVYGIVQDCGGHIGVKSSVEQGTTFTIHLPVLAGEKGDRQPLASRLGVAEGTETILLVEDDASIRNLAAKILETSGYRVLTAKDAPDARNVLAQTSDEIDLMVSDIMIPGGSGIELAQYAETLRPQMKVFYISGNPSGKLPAGSVLLQKPFSPVELAVRIRTMLDESRSDIKKVGVSGEESPAAR